MILRIPSQGKKQLRLGEQFFQVAKVEQAE